MVETFLRNKPKFATNEPKGVVGKNGEEGPQRATADFFRHQQLSYGVLSLMYGQLRLGSRIETNNLMSIMDFKDRVGVGVDRVFSRIASEVSHTDSTITAVDENHLSVRLSVPRENKRTPMEVQIAYAVPSQDNPLQEGSTVRVLIKKRKDEYLAIELQGNLGHDINEKAYADEGRRSIDLMVQITARLDLLKKLKENIDTGGQLPEQLIVNERDEKTGNIIPKVLPVIVDKLKEPGYFASLIKELEGGNLPEVLIGIDREVFQEKKGNISDLHHATAITNDEMADIQDEEIVKHLKDFKPTVDAYNAATKAEEYFDFDFMDPKFMPITAYLLDEGLVELGEVYALDPDAIYNIIYENLLALNIINEAGESLVAGGSAIRREYRDQAHSVLDTEGAYLDVVVPYGVLNNFQHMGEVSLRVGLVSITNSDEMEDFLNTGNFNMTMPVDLATFDQLTQ